MARRRRSETAEYRAQVAAYVAAGGDEDVQRAVTAVHRLSRLLNQWYDRQLADINVGVGEWAVLSELARAQDSDPLTPSQLAAATDVAPSSMTHRLDRLVERGFVRRDVDPDNRTRVHVRLSDEGWQLYADAIRESNLVESDVMAALTSQQLGELVALLEKVITGLDDDT
ncbi:MAG: MarR family winged helix-turn-helix transcriptional regulator [Propionibacteriaceae bacterium]